MRYIRNRIPKGLLCSHFFFIIFLSVCQTILLDHAVHLDCYLLDTVSNRIYHVILTTSDVYFFFLYSALRERAVVEGIKPTTEKTHRGNPIKRAKWHLGIRSQSKPQDIMNEVYRAMKTLNFVSLGNCRKKNLAFFLNQTFFL